MEFHPAETPVVFFSIYSHGYVFPPARWAPTSYEWSYNPYKWPYAWVTVFFHPYQWSYLWAPAVNW